MSDSKPPSADGTTTSDDDSEVALPFEGAEPVENDETEFANDDDKSILNQAASDPGEVNPGLSADFENKYEKPIYDKLVEGISLKFDRRHPSYDNISLEVSALTGRIGRYTEYRRMGKILTGYWKDQKLSKVPKEKEEINNRSLALYALWDKLLTQCDEAGTLILPQRNAISDYDDHYDLRVLAALWKVREAVYAIENFETKLEHRGIPQYVPLKTARPKEPSSAPWKPRPIGQEAMEDLWFYQPILDRKKGLQQSTN